MLETALIAACVALAFAVLRPEAELRRLRSQETILEKQFADAVQRIAHLEQQDSKANKLLENVVEKLVALEIPGLVLLVVMATSGYAGATAFTSALATLGGPYGMIAGVGVLLLLGQVSNALARYRLSKMATRVVKGLVAKGHSQEAIRKSIGRWPLWVISSKIRNQVEAVLGEITNRLWLLHAESAAFFVRLLRLDLVIPLFCR